MTIISDTNIFLAVALDEPEKNRIIQLSAGTVANAPEILPYELGNALSAMIKRKKIAQVEGLAAYTAASTIPVRLLSVDVQESLRLAIEFNIYAYDAYFLQCAKATSYPLLTLDKKMRKIATELHIDLLE